MGEDAMKNLRVSILVLMIFSFLTNTASPAEFVFGPASPKIPTDNNQLYLVGPIVSGDYDRFVDAIKKHDGNFFALHLRSGGGNVQEAMRIGRLVRQLLIWTYAPAPQNLQKIMPQMAGTCTYDSRVLGKPVPCICGSACVLIFLGGVFRVGWELYVHSVAFDRENFASLPPGQAAKKYQDAMSVVQSYLTEMGVDSKWFDRMLRTSSAQADKVTLAEAKELFGWEPGTREWVLAKCGGIQALNTDAGKCWSTPFEDARKVAVENFLRSR
jgi:hypothetical protein